MTSNRTSYNAISIYKPDLINLKKLISLNSTDKVYIESIIDGLSHLANNQATLSKYSVDHDQAIQALSFKYTDNKLYDLLTDNYYQISLFTRIIDRYCREDALLAKRLYEFIRCAVGPIIKLFAVERGGNLNLAVEFPTQETKTFFLRQMHIKDVQLHEMKYDIEVEALFEGNKNIVCMPAIRATNQQLAIAFPSVEHKNQFVDLLNLNKTNLINTNQNDDCRLHINDRRIHDTASSFHFSVIWLYFLEYCAIQHVARIIEQGRRDHFSFFSCKKLPKELAIAITLAAVSGNAIDGHERINIAKHVIS